MIKTAVARRYAQALFELLDASGIETTRKGLQGLAEAVSQSSALKHVLASPAFGFHEKRETLAALSRRLGCLPIVEDFLAQVVRKNRVGYLREIADEFAALADQRKGVQHVTVASAKHLTAAEQDGLRSHLRQMLRHDVDVAFEIHPPLLAGLSIRIGSRVFDSTVRGRLTAMRTLVAKE